MNQESLEKKTSVEFGTAPEAQIAAPQIPDHQLLRRIGGGSYGEVWLARNVMGTYRAVKIVYRNTFSSDRPYEREFTGIQKFEPISRSHEGLVDVLQVGRNDRAGYFYYVMELADDAAVGSPTPKVHGPKSDGTGRSGFFGGDDEKTGRGENGIDSSSRPPVFPFSSPDAYVPQTLARRLHDHGRLPAAECLELSLTLTKALGHLHQHGLIHRDIKPSNIIFVNGIPKLADIGLVADVGEARSFVGTEGFIPPEGPGTAQADLYSLGKVLYEISTGKDRQDYPELPTLLGEDADRTELLELNEVVIKSCEDDTTKRYRSAAQMHADLALLEGGQSVKRLRSVEKRLAVLTRAGAAIGLLGLCAFGAFVFQRYESQRFQKLADENRHLAGQEGHQRQRVQETFSKSDFLAAGQLLDRDQPDLAVAYLCRALKSDPGNNVAGTKLLTTLLHNNFLSLAYAPLQHEDAVTSVAVSRNGKILVTGSRDHTARVWDLASGKLLLPPFKHDGPITAVAITADGAKAVTASADKTAQVWDLVKGQPLTPPLKHADAVNAVAFSPDGMKVVTGCEDGAVQIWSGVTGAALAPPFRHEGPITSLAVSSDGSKVVTASLDKTARVLSLADGKPLTPVLPHGGAVNSIAISPDQTKILTVSIDRTLKIWDLASGKLLGRPRQHPEEQFCLAVSPDGTRVVTGGTGNAAHIWDITSDESAPLTLKHDGAVSSIAISSDGAKVITGSVDRTARVWDMFTGRPLTPPLKHERVGGRFVVAISPDSAKVITGSGDSTVRVWELAVTRALPMPLYHELVYSTMDISMDGRRVFVDPKLKWTYSFQCLAFTPDGSKLISGAADKTARVWDPATGAQLLPPLRHGGAVLSLAVSADGRELVTGSWDNHVRVWNLVTGEPIALFSGHDGPVLSVALSPDGRTVASGSGDGTARVWSVPERKLVYPPLSHVATDRGGATVWRVAITPDGAKLLTGSADGTARIWNLATGQPLTAPLRHDGPVYRLTVSPDGTKMVTGTWSSWGMVRVWEIATGKPLTPPMKQGGSIEGLLFSPDGNKLISASGHTMARVLDIATGNDLIPYLQHLGPIVALALSPDGKQIVTGADDKTSRVWDMSSGEALTPPQRHETAVYAVAVSPNGRQMVTEANQIVRVWDLLPAGLEIPDWFVTFAESMASARINASGFVERVAPAEFFERRAHIRQMKGDGAVQTIARWLVADRAARSISPFLKMQASEYVRRRIAEDSLESLREVVQMAPNNGIALARLARRVLEQEENPRRLGEADFYSRRAIEVAPNDAEVAQIRVAIASRIQESR